MRYLDPKNDLIFKRIFGEHPDILLSFLNAVLPLDDGKQIVSLEYLPAELVPEIPGLKNSIVDVRCMDVTGRLFIVEMQMFWIDSFKSRVLFNAAKAYVRQVDKGDDYKGLEPVYALSIVNQDFENDTENHYHHYKLVETTESKIILKGLELVFIELQKFIRNYKNENSIGNKKINTLWLRFLAEIKNETEMISKDLLEIPEIAKAVELTKESSFTKTELEVYDKYWDAISIQKSIVLDSEAKGRAEGKAEGELAGAAKAEARIHEDIILNGYANGVSIKILALLTKLAETDITTILKQHNKIED